ncbi:bifunctional hydroxymethylpyrimidine kinase/phosphomethylpyrimidine kinase [Alysiella filiformis]|uniref:hydroxymethylpyrimidine kinase n=1 Tax=Alysiella filiformis DSM 16848 TaxID=1120981 RepID=A0A286ENY3_9NEIS|nr:bifunctional hydroxymethylpyrimidine kinase/phosphomethylpyrimidine kinase [Alysiella filiformis]QMT32196.1 bifunctional hydroxymethylpyrimidine kinase/phosphomethylpyrimidine kinase [Alysiella filiformis]UBQ56882.1 bifunctional hydroxymethylpyrimidine kinase/phosphomethylpyrimidine kinase [Alysiella filiformis DSM 16848]SOD72615.1 hydroxymethylpyrimidine/phosphomethylpyrimidine kinase [Alysiella filiformis DSM 16848]
MTKQVLTIAGSDSGGGAGIQADLKTFQMRGVFGTSVITAVTAQNTLGVDDIHMISLENVAAQIQSIGADFDISAYKIGMLGTAEMIECVANSVKKQKFGTLVLDPVMVAKGGAPLLQESALHALKRELLPLADIITPNLPETEMLTGVAVHDDASAERAARILRDFGVQHIVIKGGHLGNSGSLKCRDWVFSGETMTVLEQPRFNTRHTHGTGCTFSACIVAELAKGKDILSAISLSKQAITDAISHPIGVGHGHGAVNHWAMADFQAA